MPTTTLYLIRHAEPEPAGGDPGLTAFGRQQSAEVAQALRSIPHGAILHSPARRAIETATIVANELGVSCGEDSRAVDLTPIPDDWSTVPGRYHDDLCQVPASMRDVGGRRLDAAFASLGEIGPVDRTIVMVTHNFVIAWFVRKALDAPWWRWIGLNQDHAAVSTIQWASDAEPRLLRFNASEYGETDLRSEPSARSAEAISYGERRARLRP